MAENADGIDESTLFTYEPGEEGAPDPAPKADEPPAKEEPAPAKETEKASEPAKAEPEADTLTLEELTASLSETAKKAVAEAIEAERARATEDDDDTPQDVKDLRAENARLKAENEQRAKALADREEAEEVAKLEHQMASAAGKYKMTEGEIETVVEYMTANADLVMGGMKFEEAALRRLPDLRTRLRTEPPAREAPASPASEAPPSGSGMRAPAPFKHKAEPGSYSDITEHLLKTGQAAALFTKD